MNKSLQTTLALHLGWWSHIEQLQIVATFCLFLPEDGTRLRRGKTGNCIDAVAYSKCPLLSGHSHFLKSAIRKTDCSNYAMWIADFRATGETEIVVVVVAQMLV